MIYEEIGVTAWINKDKIMFIRITFLLFLKTCISSCRFLSDSLNFPDLGEFNNLFTLENKKVLNSTARITTSIKIMTATEINTLLSFFMRPHPRNNENKTSIANPT